MNRPAPLAEAFQFSPPTGETPYNDEAIIGSDMAGQTVEKVKDFFSGGER